jgi:hypothetical protein
MFLLRWLRRLVKAVIWLIVLIILTPIVGLAYGFLTTSDLPRTPLSGISEGVPHESLAAQVRAEVPGYQRPEESTFLTYPEWAIVYAAREYAGFVAEQSPSDFPYWAYIGRYWQDYATMIRATSSYPFNMENHLMLVVIGTSHTIEHAIQSVYENTIGRVTELVSGPSTDADRYLALVAAQYAAFLDQVPWYEFPYAEKRTGLISLDSPAGMRAVRVVERQIAFGVAFWIKQQYADLIKQGLAATSDPAALDIHVWAKGPIGEAVRVEDDTLLERDLGDAGSVFVTKRYQVFTEMIPRLIERGIAFVEIGGNDEILVTVLTNGQIVVPDGARELFAYQLPARPDRRRTGLLVAVRKLNTALPTLTAAGAELEHVYDY